MLDSAVSVAQTVLDHSECAEVFKRHRIDFCCRGHLSIEEAAHERGVPTQALLAELGEAVRTRHEGASVDPRRLSTPGLTAHIVATHHAYLRKVLPFIEGLALKVGRVHGDHNPKLRDLAAAVSTLAATLLPHLTEEEEVLFPALASRDADPRRVATLLDSMTAEHLQVADLLTRIRTAAEDFHLPEWACNSYRTLFAELQQLESDTFTHVHLENHVLAPRALVRLLTPA